MSDNFTANAGSGGSTFAADDIGPGVLHPRVKVEWGVDGTVNDASVTNPLPVQVIPTTSGGLTIYSLESAATTNATNVKASAGKVHWMYVTNTNAAVRYMKVYDSASAPTAGSGTPVLRLAIPAAATGAGFVFASASGLSFASGIGFTLVTGAGDSASTGVGADEIQVNIGYV